MNVFKAHSQIVDDYASYIRSFINISGVKASLEDQVRSAALGYDRPARIRFSHVGEMASTPCFTNSLAEEVRKRDARVRCVVYTRHPDAGLLDSELLIVNL